MTARTWYRLGLASAIGTALLLLYGIGALGIIGSGGPPDLLYLGVLAIALAGAVISRLRARGMALALAATAAATAVAGIMAVATGLHRRDGASVPEIIGLTGMYAGLFALSAWLFWRGAGQSPEGVPTAG